MTTPDEMPVTGLTATQAHELVAAGRGVLVDTRDARLFDNAHAGGALSLPLATRSEEHTSELQSQSNLVCRLLLEKKKKLLSRQRASYTPDSHPLSAPELGTTIRNHTTSSSSTPDPP